MRHFRVFICPIKTHRSCGIIRKTQLDCPVCSPVFWQAASKDLGPLNSQIRIMLTVATSTPKSNANKR